MTTAGWRWPSARHLSPSPDRAELRQALRRDRLSWYPEDIYLVGEDGPMERKPVRDGATVLWGSGGRWFVDHSERGSVDERKAWVFPDEGAACRWLYDLAYLERFAVGNYLWYMEDLGDEAAAESARRHQEACRAAHGELMSHPHGWELKDEG